jgi:hypothetical protein
MTFTHKLAPEAQAFLAGLVNRLEQIVKEAKNVNVSIHISLEKKDEPSRA